jgi:hypothetical protein
MPDCNIARAVDAFAGRSLTFAGNWWITGWLGASSEWRQVIL